MYRSVVETEGSVDDWRNDPRRHEDGEFFQNLSTRAC
jgi:hypothetical protein